MAAILFSCDLEERKTSPVAVAKGKTTVVSTSLFCLGRLATESLIVAMWFWALREDSVPNTGCYYPCPWVWAPTAVHSSLFTSGNAVAIVTFGCQPLTITPSIRINIVKSC